MSRPLTTLQSVLEGADDAPALLLGSGGGTLTRGQLRRLCNQFAASLRASGVQPGDVVTIAEPNTVEYVVAFLGTGLARAVAAPLNQNYRQEEFEFYMDDAKSKLLVVGRDGNAAAEAAGKAPCLTLSVHVPAAGGEPRLEVGSKTQGWEAKLAGEEAGATLQDPPQADDEALFLHTSGTTARPKGVPLSQGNLAASLANIVQTYEFIPADRSLLVMPLFHVHGLMAGLLAPLAAGAAVILPAAGKFSASTFWQDAVEHSMTFYTAVPTMHQILLARAEQDYPAAAPPPLRAIRSCSSALAPATLHKLEAAFKAPVLEAYAMTEASHQMTSNPLPKHGEHRPGTVGKAQGSVKVAILDEQCNVLPPGQIGEVCIRGPNVTQGYKDNPKANEEAFAGGWFHTGDQGHLDAEGYLTLTGRIKELINRGGEKISPIEVDGALLAHPGVAEAVSFAAPDEKYGEVVAAAVVLNEEGKKMQNIEEDIQRVVGQRLSAFKVPKFVFVTDQLPKGPTGKISRRFMVDAFIKKEGGGAAPPGSQKALAIDFSKQPNDGYFLVARALARLGVRHMFGVIGIPVTQLASAAQACGIRFISCRNEQAAGYAAAAAGFLTGVPGVLLTVSGPGVVHGIAGLSNAQVNCWPLVMISGSCEQNEVGKGAFQECDQLAAVAGHVKWAGQAATAADIPRTIAQAFQAASSGRPGAAYVDIPSNILMASVDDVAAVQQAEASVAGPLTVPRPAPPADDVAAAAQLLRGAQRPLLVVGKGAGYAQAEGPLRQLAEAAGLPFLATAMGRGVVPDDSSLCVNAARSMALGQADVALVVGARLNWQLHFGEPPRWSSTVKFILLDVEPSEQDAAKSAVVLRGDAGTGATALLAALRQGQPAGAPLLPGAAASGWLAALQGKVAGAREKLAAKMARTAFPLDYHTTLRVVRDELNRLPQPAVVVSEGANTMDNARVLLEPVIAPRSRLDAGTWGTMGVGPGYAIAAGVVAPDRNVVAVEGDSAFGFSGMECETICRYNLPVCIVVMNNGGIYGGDRREQHLRELAAAGLAAAGVPTDPAPTDFVPQSKYHLLMEAFGGIGVAVATADELQAALRQALESRRPTLINVAIDPQAGAESGSVHAFNAPKGGS